jgi:uncharacterized membrane protein YraQ (UPF0718 family)
VNNAGAYILYGGAVLLGIVALLKHDDSFRRGLSRAAEQALVILPRLIFAMIAANFIVTFIPSDSIVRFLGADGGLTAVLIGTLAGMIVPSGPAVAFSVAAAFALEGASAPALVAYLTSWSVFAAHRIFIFELPLLGASFVKLRVISVIPLPLLAGTIAILVGNS